MNNLIVSPSPHLHTKTTTTGIMRDVIIALAPSAVAGVVFYGLKAAILIAVCVCTAVLSEFLFNLITKKKQTIGDLSAIVTGLILALTLPTKTTIWHCVVGTIFAIIVVKCLFGGLGCNFANPAATARVMMLIAFSGTVAGGGINTIVDLEAGATPLASIAAGEGNLPSLLDMFLGVRHGAIGEGCIVAIVIGFIYLVVRRVIKWETPVIYAGVVFLLSLAIKQDLTAALYQVMGGGVVFAAVFMATDYVTTPINRLGKMVFAAGCGIITVLIRFWGSYPEGASFAILLMNILSPYIEKMCARKALGGAKK